MASPYSKPPPPNPSDLPAGRFGRWLYEFWDYVARNKVQAVTDLAAGTGIVLGTGTATYTVAHRTSGVAAGTYGNSTAVAQVVVDALGHVAAGTTLPISFPSGSLVLASDVLGTGVVPGTLTAALSTTGVAAGTYGKSDFSAQITVDAKGRITAATEVAITGGTGTGIASADINVTAPLRFSVGTGTGAVLQPFTLALATTGVSTGTYGAPAGIPRFDIDAFGRVLAGTAVGTLTSLQLGSAFTEALTVAGKSTLGDDLEFLGASRQILSTSARFGFNLSAAGGTYVVRVGGDDRFAVTTGEGTFAVPIKAPTALIVGTATAAFFQGGYLNVGAGDLVGTSTTGTFTAALGTTGVTAGTYGAPEGIPRFDIDAKGRVLSGTSVGTLNSLVVGTGVDSATVLTVLGGARLRRMDTSAEGGQVTFDRAFDGSSAWAWDVVGTGTGDVRFRVVDIRGPSVPFSIVRSEVLVSTNLRVTGTALFAGTATAAFFQGAFSQVAVGDILGTSTTGTLTAALSTTGVTAGTYGGSDGTPRFGVDAKGRVTEVANYSLTAVPPLYINTLTNGFSWFHNTSGVSAGTYGTGNELVRFTVDIRGHLSDVTPSGTLGTFARFASLALAGVVTGTTTTGTLTGAFAPNPSFSGTATTTGLHAFGRVAAAVGTSATVDAVPVTLTGSAGSVSSTAVSFSLMTSAIPANAMLRAGRGFEVNAWGTVGTAQTNIGLVYGTGTLISNLSVVAQRWAIHATVLAESTSAQRYNAFMWLGASPLQSGGALALGAGTAALLNIQGTKAGSTAAVVQEGFLVRFNN